MSTTKLIRLAKHFEYKYNFKQAQQVTEPDPFENYVKNYYNNRMTTHNEELPNKPSIRPELSQKQKELHNVINTARDSASSAAIDSAGNAMTLFNQLASSLNRLKSKVIKNTLTKDDVATIQGTFNKALIENKSSEKKVPAELLLSLRDSIHSITQSV